MLLILDNYDSFTYNLVDHFRQLGIEHRVLKNDECTIEQIAEMKPEGIVLSPGPGRPADAGVCLKLIKAFHQDTPILGICLGHQAIGEYFGAQLVNSKEPVHGKTAELILNPDPIWEGIEPNSQVMRYHSLILESIEGTPLKELAHTKNGEIMAIVHVNLPIYGLQFHPESILTTKGIKYISNWLKIVNFSNIASWNE